MVTVITIKAVCILSDALKRKQAYVKQYVIQQNV